MTERAGSRPLLPVHETTPTLGGPEVLSSDAPLTTPPRRGRRLPGMRALEVLIAATFPLAGMKIAKLSR